jgi:hypothetical protein
MFHINILIKSKKWGIISTCAGSLRQLIELKRWHILFWHSTCVRRCTYKQNQMETMKSEEMKIEQKGEGYFTFRKQSWLLLWILSLQANNYISCCYIPVQQSSTIADLSDVMSKLCTVGIFVVVSIGPIEKRILQNIWYVRPIGTFRMLGERNGGNKF